MEKEAAIFVAGHRGLVGSAIVQRLRAEGFTRVLTATRQELDLRDQAAVYRWFHAQRPEYVFVAAGTVGGIQANSTRPAEFLYDNLMIHATVIHAAHMTGTRKLLYLGSNCMYPRACKQPMREEYILTGALEPTNEAYAIAKIAGVKMCQFYRKQYGRNFISAIPTSAYGPYDNFDLRDAHVVPSLIRRFHEAARDGRDRVVLWGTGSPTRELIYVNDLADACVFLMQQYDGDRPINVGTGVEVSIRQLAEVIQRISASNVELVFDSSKPDGMPRKLLDSTQLHALGWRSKVGLEEGIRLTTTWFREHYEEAIARRGLTASASATQ